MSADACAIADYRNGRVPDDEGDERHFVVKWAGERIDVWATVYGVGRRAQVDIDCIERGGKVIESSDIDDETRDAMVKLVRAELQREEDEALCDNWDAA